MAKLYLMRHGQTRFNLLGKMQGHCDSPLTDLGVVQAQISNIYFKNLQIEFSNVYSSTQERAVDTAEIVSGKSPIRLKSLKEWSFGNFEGESGSLLRDIDWFNDWNFFVPFGGESRKQLQERVLKALKDIMISNESALVVSHCMVLKVFTNMVIPEQNLNDIKFGNCCIMIFNFTNGIFKFQEIINHN